MKTQVFRLMVVVVGVGVLAVGLSLRLEGAPPSPYAERKQTDALRDVNRHTAITNANAFVLDRTTQPVPATSTSTVKFGEIPTTGLRVVSTVTVDYRDDRGTRERAAGKLFGPLPSRTAGNATAACTPPACSFDIECDDGNKCTNDTCEIPAGQGPCVGTCTHPTVADGQVGECDDNLFCNGEAHCESGVCVAGLPAACCSTAPNQTQCVEAFPRCSEDSGIPGAGCRSDGDCPGGVCERCQPVCLPVGQCSTADGTCCDDGRKCNGVETCVDGLCIPGKNPCGAGADCFEGDCIPIVQLQPCNSNLDCTSPNTCNFNAGPICFQGRCCVADGGDPDDQMDCFSPERALAFSFGGQPSCQSEGGLWFAGDSGRDDNSDPCGGYDRRNPDQDPWGCPKFGRGIVQSTAADAPVYPVTVGPISDSPVGVPAPGGPGGPLNQMGDDYTLSNGSYLGLDAMRWAGGALNGNRISMDFYDAAGNFVEDIVLGGIPIGTLGINVVIFNPKMTIPPSGYVVMRTAEDFAPDTKFVWFSTTNANPIGTNDANKVWVNGAPATGAANFLGAGNGIMAYELVGDKDPAPIGSCCDKDSGECEDGVVSWVCRERGDVFNGIGSICASCDAGPTNGTTCRRCSNNATQSCTGDAACDVQTQGTCNTGTHLCTAGLPTTTACNINDDCDLHFSCDPNGAAGCTQGGANCVAQPACGNGACCDLVTGDCSYTTEVGCSGNFQGFGTSCDADEGAGDEGEQHCCRKPTSQKCMGGPNNNMACTVNSDCGRCTSGATQNNPCNNDAACSTPAENGVCTSETCVGGARAGLPCVTALDCQGSVCDGRCLARNTGADSCEDAFIHDITVPGQGDPPVVITISGDNSFATSTFAHPDSCNDPSTDANADPGWYEAFTTDACALVRIDRCCSDPVRQPEYPIVITDCYEGCGTTLIYAVNPYVQGQAPFFRGKPYCEEDNLWFTLGLLPAGTYWMPIYAALAGAHGPYQIHITVEACPAAACCHMECSGAPADTPCTGSGQGSCPSGQTCNLQCDELNQYECDVVQGFYNGPPQLPNPVPLCVDTPCATGSCCTGPGLCNDHSQNSGNPMTRAVCEAAPFNGTFLGGPNCFGGECTGGANDGYSCNDPGLSQCNLQGQCVGSAAELAQPNPCPICEIGGADNCQNFDNAFQFAPSDRTYGTGMVAADDFVLGADGTISTVCVWGYYVDNNPDTPLTDCALPFAAPAGGGPTLDNFRVKIYADSNGLPGTVVGESAATADRAIISGAITTATYTPPIETYGFQLALTTPIGVLTANQCYWLQVSNDTGATPADCYWVWTQLDPTSSVGNKYSMGGSVATGYPPGSEKQADQAFCLNTNFLAGGCDHGVRACCTCSSPAVCSEETLETCTNGTSHWQATQLSCTGFTCPVKPPTNDLCDTPLEVTAGSYGWQTFCAGTDGYNPVPTDFGTDSILNDIWFNYTVPNNPAIDDLIEKCTVVADICPSGLSFDSMVAIYHNPDDPTVCPCPQDLTAHNATFVQANDENCTENAVGGPAFAEAEEAKPGFCYTIRVGGFPGPNDEGLGQLDVSCGPLFCGDNRKSGTESCDGTDDADCPGGCTAVCTCGASAVCGDGVISGREECDPNCTNCNQNPGQLVTGCYSTTCLPDTDPNKCTCVPLCGNNNIEAGEDCDGTSHDDDCPDNCGVGAAACHCPPPICGNGVIDTIAGEECEANTDCPDDGLCRSPGDPIGGCTCACPPVAVIPNIFWDSAPLSGNRTTRSLKFRVDSPATADASAGQTAIKVTPVSLQRPDPKNLPQNTPPNFSTYDTMLNGVCSGGTHPGHRCDADAHCSGGTCGSLVGCTAAGETNGCARWVGKPATFLESQDNPGIGNYRAARLQCTPFYTDWVAETHPGGVPRLLSVVGAEIAPSSEYAVQAYASSCKGAETGCSDVSTAVPMFTRRSGDVEAPFNPPATSDQPNAVDVTQLVNKFKNATGALVKSVAQLQPNLPEQNADISALDIVAVVDGVKQFQYAFSGPCTCPSAVTCGGTPCATPGVCVSTHGAGALCVKTCNGGDNSGDPCINNTHCPGGACSNGFCRDRCGRCKP